jgi:hypothetical protein
MIDYTNASFSANVANEILSRALEYQNNNSKISLPDIPHFTLEQVFDAGKEAGLTYKSIETAADAYFDEQVIRRTNLTKTRITEERVLESEADQLTIWHQVLSELTYRMGGKPVIQTFKYKENIWKLTDRTGNDTTIKLHKQGRKVKLMLSQKISYYGPAVESLLSGWSIAAIIGLYFFVFMPTSLALNSVIIIGLMALMPLLIRRILERKRTRKINQFERLADQITDQIPRFKIATEKKSGGEAEPKTDSNKLFSIRKEFTKRDTRF